VIRPATESLRQARGFSKVVTAVVLAAFVSLTLQPLALAAQLPSPPARAKVATTAADPSAQLAQTLEALEAALEALEARLTQRQDAAPQKAEVKALEIALERLDQQAQQDFEAIEQRLKANNLPPVIFQRHQEAVQTYKTEMQTLKQNLNALESALDDDDRTRKAKKAKDHLKEKQKKRAHTPVDPNNLPFRTPDGKVRPPHETPQAFRASLFKPEPIQVASTELTAGMLSTELLSVAAVAAAPTPADLAPTEDVQITPEVQALAVSLNNNPVKIYNWVRNNIKFLPTYGSIQGSQMTLESKQGNAFDTASLLIALLRASGIHSRYVYGTVQIPVEKVMNWVGGVTKPDAAQQLLGQGGIPNIGLVQGGQITHIKLEHVWVEGFIDFYPSRGAVHKQGDSWVPLDASFKQYQFTQGMDIKTNVPFDAQSFVNQVKASATINETEGWVTGLSEAIIQNTVIDYQNRVQAYVNTTNPNATVGDALGTQSIIADKRTVLAASLPYQKLAIGNRFAGIPSSLRHTVTLNLYASALDRVLASPALSYTIGLPALNTHRLGVTYQPATSADLQLIQSYTDQGATSLPVYLIQMKPVVQMDGTTVASGSPITMGTAQYWDATLTDPQGSHTGTESFEATAGDEIVFGVNGNGITPEIVQNRLNTVVLHSAAENLHQVSLHYWMEHDLFDGLTAKAHGVYKQRLPSVGLFSSPLSVSFFFGVPRTGNYKGRQMDVKRVLLAAVAKDDKTQFAFMSQIGIQGSYLEGSVFDQLFSRAQGTSPSAAQILMEANRQNIPIYTITATNINDVLPILAVSNDVKADISSAISADRVAVVPKQELSLGSWTGAGYILQDKQTGAGAYLISGGLNGAVQPACASSTAPLVTAILGVIASLFIGLSTISVTAAVTVEGGLILISVVITAPAILITAVIGLILSTIAIVILLARIEASSSSDSCCPACPAPPPPEIDRVPPSDPHFPCPGDHWHYFEYHQGPPPACICRLVRKFGGCLPQGGFPPGWPSPTLPSR